MAKSSAAMEMMIIVFFALLKWGIIAAISRKYLLVPYVLCFMG